MGLDLLCVGLTTLDIAARTIERLPAPDETILIEGVEVTAAGTAAGAAVVAGMLGLNVGLSGAIGDDRKGRFVRMSLEEAGVDTSLLAVVPGAQTSTTILTIDSQGRRPHFHAMGASFRSTVTAETLAAARTARFVHWGGVGGPKLDGGPGEELLKAAQASGAVTTLDLISPQRSALVELRRLLPHVDYFLPSAAEAFALSDADDIAGAAAFFMGLGAKACIIKNGGAGCYAAIGDERVILPAHDIVPVDTTSCGDSFCAGFIAALARGWTPMEACRFATATAALVAQGLGTAGIVTSFQATEKAMHEMPLRKTSA